MKEVNLCKKLSQLVKGSMIAVLGSDLSTIKDLLKSISNEPGVCEVANDNATGQIILSGNKSKVDNFKNILKKNKIKSIPLKVSAPFHCSLMIPAAEKMREKIETVTFNKPIKNIVSNVTAQSESDPKKLKFISRTNLLYSKMEREYYQYL